MLCLANVLGCGGIVFGSWGVIEGGIGGGVVVVAEGVGWEGVLVEGLVCVCIPGRSGNDSPSVPHVRMLLYTAVQFINIVIGIS
jgi:hypothetical protein